MINAENRNRKTKNNQTRTGTYFHVIRSVNVEEHLRCILTESVIDMAKTISFGLSVKEIQNAIKEIKAYQSDLNRKCEELCRRLIQEGILIGQTHIGSSGFGKYIHLGSEITPQQAGCKAILYMEDTTKIKSEWQTKEGVQSAEVSPCLMLEFGSGLKAQNPTNVPNVGAGSFGEHGLDPSGWWYMDLDGVWHHSNGVSPKMPMYFAGRELREKVVAVAREVFGT